MDSHWLGAEKWYAGLLLILLPLIRDFLPFQILVEKHHLSSAVTVRTLYVGNAPLMAARWTVNTQMA